MTNKIPRIVDTATTFLISPVGQLSPQFTTFFSTVHKIHSVWRWNRRWERIQADPHNLKKLLAGYVMGIAVGDCTILRIAARLTLIANRLLQCAKQKLRFYHACVDWKREFTGQSLLPPSLPPLESLAHSKTALLFSPGKTFIWQTKLSHLHLRIRRVFRATILLVVEAFKLSMHYMDVVQAFSLSPEATSDGMQEFFLNFSQFFQDLEENRETLVANLKRQKPVIQLLIDQLQVNLRADDLITKVDQIMRGTNFVYNTVAPAGSAVLDGYKWWGTWVWASLTRQDPESLKSRNELLAKVKQKRIRYRYAHNPALNASRSSRSRRLPERFFATLN